MSRPQYGVTQHDAAPRRSGRPMLEGWMIAAIAVALVGAALGIALLVRPAIGRTGAGGALSDPKTASRAANGASSPPISAPTAVFAHMKKYAVPLHLPAAPGEMLAVGFHQSWNVRGTDMIPALQVHPRDKYESTKQALRADPALKLFLMMSRGRGSSEYTAADCAVKPGSTILSPVTGTVTLIKRYKLSGTINDYQLEIKADGASPVRVVMIHIQDLRVRVGERVEGGVTPVATVRHLTLDNQVNRYLPWPADHTHIQINDVGYTLTNPI